MPHEDSKVRLKGTGLIGTIIDFEPGSDHCMVDPDLWSATEGPAGPFEVDLSDIEELIEVNDSDRREVCEAFDLIKLDARVEIRLDKYYQLVIEQENDGYRVQVARFFDQEGGEGLLLEGGDAEKLHAEIGKMKSYRWIEPFEPKGYLVLDGYSWDMEVYSGNRYYSCVGNNATPQELLDFVDYVASLGLPMVDVFD